MTKWKLGDYQNTLIHCDKFLKIRPKVLPVLYLKAKAFYSLCPFCISDFEIAFSHFENVVNVCLNILNSPVKNTILSEAYYFQAIILSKINESKNNKSVYDYSVVTYFDKCLEINPKCSSALFQKGNVFLNLGIEDGFEIILKSIKISSKYKKSNIGKYALLYSINPSMVWNYFLEFGSNNSDEKIEILEKMVRSEELSRSCEKCISSKGEELIDSPKGIVDHFINQCKDEFKMNEGNGKHFPKTPKTSPNDVNFDDISLVQSFNYLDSDSKLKTPNNSPDDLDKKSY